jgi:hypothetical protein
MSIPKSVVEDISAALDGMFRSVRDAADKITLREILEEKNPLIRGLFNETAKEYVSFFVMERVERSLVTTPGHVVADIVWALIRAQNGDIIGSGERDWKPYDLKFVLDGRKYWREIKSILEQNSSNWKG